MIALFPRTRAGRRPDRFWTISLPDGVADYTLRVGDSTESPEGQTIVVVLIIGPRQVIARPPRPTDHWWMWAAYWRDVRLLGPRPKD